MGTELTTVERSRLRTLEKVIDQGLETYVRVGMALAEVKAAKLYRDDYGTWSDYCKDRWGFTQQHAGRLINASETAQRILKSEPRGSLLEAPPTEKHASALAKAPPEEQAEIWEDVLDEHEEPTAQDVKKAVEARTQSAKAQLVDEGASSISIVKDELDRDVPERLRLAFSASAELAAIGRQVDSLKRQVEALAGKPGGHFIATSTLSLTAKDLKSEINGARYWTACPRCGGDGCERCDQTGFIPRSRKNQLSHEDREALGL